MQVVSRRVPITEKNPERSTKGIYALADPFLRFWFRYVFPHRSTIELGRGEELFLNTVKPDLSNFMGSIYEQMCYEEIGREGQTLLGFQPMRIGRYWEPQAEIDLVAEDARRGHVAFIECKWSRNVNVSRIIGDLSRKTDLISAYAGVSKSIYVMSRTDTDHPNHIRFG
jgi:AAA+ ATPase superfamily predicted ATPase